MVEIRRLDRIEGLPVLGTVPCQKDIVSARVKKDMNSTEIHYTKFFEESTVRHVLRNMCSIDSK